MRNYKTAQSKRDSYVYYNADGTTNTITTNDAGKGWIKYLHQLDDEEYNAHRREDYHVPVHYDAYFELDENEVDDRNLYLVDFNADPLDIIIRMIEEKEHCQKLLQLKEAFNELEPKQQGLIINKFWRSKINTEIAAEEGVSETAIRNRLKTIYKILRSKILSRQ